MWRLVTVEVKGRTMQFEKNVVYPAGISPMEHNKDVERVYVGISAGNWKQRKAV